MVEVQVNEIVPKRNKMEDGEGAGSPLTVPQLREANNFLSPNIIFLSETKNKFSYMKKVQKILRFKKSVIVEAMDWKEGMALFWNNAIEFRKVVTTALTIEALWKVLTVRKQLWGDKWLLAGDFNDILSNEEKWEGRARDERSVKDFSSFIENNSLMDLGFTGNPWTWSNNWENEREIRQRLDRGLSTINWCQNFDKAECEHVETLGSDHSMLLIDNWPRIEKRRSRFFLDKRWLKRDDINQVVEQAWTQPVEGNSVYRITRQVANCRVTLLKWKNRFTGNSLLRINEVKQQIKEIKDSKDSGFKDKIAELKTQLKEAYSKEEQFWAQKARVDCSDSEGLAEILNGIPRTITTEMNDKLTREVDEMEIKSALFSMNPNKTPGQDGTSLLFFQKFWHVVKPDLIAAIRHFFQSSNMPKSWNHTVISLIPKIQNPTNLKSNRPISLCNVVYKVISKILANRLKNVLSHCINKNQAAFIPGKQILDNVILSHEYLHYMKNKKQGQNGLMAMKLDMSKAYDRVEWKFLDAMMDKMGYCTV
nr:uncharacterized protein LOC113689183 [Coffea arabica]